ncbi:MAG: amidohydrolase family protein [Chloroflexi bacterium]|nr:amidohydrolase family protein [Chloroflexota bacterium]
MSGILDQWRLGLGLPGVMVIDGHTHAFGWDGWRTPLEVAAELIRLMDGYCVDASCVMGGMSLQNGVDVRLNNDFLLECVRHAPDRLIPFAHVNPHVELSDTLAELDRVFGEGVRGIKLYNEPQGYPGDGPNMMAVYSFAQDHNMLILNHLWSEVEISRIVREFPNLVLIRGHGGASVISRTYANVYDNIWSLNRLGLIEDGVRKYGSDKLLLGSDAPLSDPAVGVGMVVYSDISDRDKRAILGLNMACLLEKVGALPNWLWGRYRCAAADSNT